MQDPQPLVSIITPVYNGAKYLDDLILSVRQQSYPAIEHIIVDDGSNDDGATVSILRQYKYLRWWTRANQGQYFTMNEGLRAATGKFACFISADDLLMPEAITHAIRYLRTHPSHIGVYGRYAFIDSFGNRLNYFNPMKFMPTSFYPYSLHIAHSSLYFDKDFVIENNLFFDKHLKFIGDYDWLIRLIRSGGLIGKVSNHYSAIRIHSNQTSKVKFFEMRNEVREAQKRLGISQTTAWFFRKIMFVSEMGNIAMTNGIRSMLGAAIFRVKRGNY